LECKTARFGCYVNSAPSSVAESLGFPSVPVEAALAKLMVGLARYDGDALRRWLVSDVVGERTEGA